MMIKLVVVVVVFCLVSFAEQSGTNSTVTSKCREYKGQTCFGGTSKLNVALGKSDSDIERELQDLLESETYEYSACKDFMNKVICTYTMDKCTRHLLTKQEKAHKPCRETCIEIRKTICYKELSENSKLKIWLENKLKCDTYSNRIDDGYCTFIEAGSRFKLMSCYYDYQTEGLKIDQKLVIKASIKSPKMMNPLEKNYIAAMLPTYFSKQLGYDLKCYTTITGFNDVNGASQIQNLPNFNSKCLSKIKPTIYCTSQKKSRQTVQITLLSSGEKLYTPDRFLSLENVNYAVLTDNIESKLVAYGTMSICHEGGFKYNIQSYKSINSRVTVFDAVATAPITMDFLEFYFSLQDELPEHIISTLRKFKYVADLKLNNIHWSTIWEENPANKLHLLQDNTAETVLSLGPFGKDYMDKDINIKFETFEMFIGSRSRFFSNYFEVKGLEVIDFMRSVLPPEIDALSDTFEIYGLRNLLNVETVQYMFKTSGDYSKSIPVKSPHFNKDDAKSIEFVRDSAYDGIAQAFGKFKALAILKRPWLKDVTFKLSALSKGSKLELKLEFNYDHHNPSCKINEGIWEGLNVIVEYLRKSAECDCTKYSISKKMKLNCKRCCGLDEQKLTRIRFYDFRGNEFSLDLTIRQKSSEVTHIFENLSLWILYEIPEKWHGVTEPWGSGDAEDCKTCDGMK